MRTQRQPEKDRISRKEFIDIFGLTPDAVVKQTGIPLSELGKTIGDVARKMHLSPRSTLNYVRCLGISETFLLNIAIKHNKRRTQKDATTDRNKMA